MKVFTLVLLLPFASLSNAQKMTAGMVAQYASPVGDFNQIIHHAVGGSAEFHLRLSPEGAAHGGTERRLLANGITSGFSVNGGTQAYDVYHENRRLKIIPLLFSLRYYASASAKPIRFFVDALGGINLFRYRLYRTRETHYIPNISLRLPDTAYTKPVWAVGGRGGVEMRFSPASKLRAVLSCAYLYTGKSEMPVPYYRGGYLFYTPRANAVLAEMGVRWYVK